MLFSHDAHGNKFPEKQLEEEVLFETDTPTASITLQKSILGFDLIRVHGSIGGNVDAFVAVTPDEIVNMSGAYIMIGSQSTSYTRISNTSTDTTLNASSTSSGGLLKVVGIKKRYAVENNSVIIPVNGGLNVAVKSRYEVQLPADYYNQDGRIKHGVTVVAEVYNNSGSGVEDWGITGHFTDASGISRFAVASVIGDKVIVQTGNDGLVNQNPQFAGHAFGILSAPLTSAPCRVRAILNDQLPITVQKGLGGLVKSAAQNIGTLSATPVQVTFNAVAFTKYFRMVTQNVANGTLAHGLEGSWRTDLALNCSFESSNSVRTVTFEVYRVSDGQTVETDTVELLRNQTNQKLWMNRVFEVLNSNVDYAVRVLSIEGVNTFVINSARWTTTLVMS